MRNVMLAVVLATTALMLPGTVSASSANGELCAVQTWDQGVVVSVHRSGFLPAGGAPQGQIDAAASQCTNLAAIDGWMPADKNYDDLVGQVYVCWMRVQPGLAYVVHAGATGISPAINMCASLQEQSPTDVAWF